MSALTPASHLVEDPARRGQPWNVEIAFYGWLLVVPGGDRKGRTEIEVLGFAKAGVVPPHPPHPHWPEWRPSSGDRDLYLRVTPKNAERAHETIALIAQREGLGCLRLLRELRYLALHGPDGVQTARSTAPAAPSASLLPAPWAEAGFSLGAPTWNSKPYHASFPLCWEGRGVGTVEWSETAPASVKPLGGSYSGGPFRWFLADALAVIIKELTRRTITELTVGEFETTLRAEADERLRRAQSRARTRGAPIPDSPATPTKSMVARLMMAIRADDDRGASVVIEEHTEAPEEVLKGVLPAAFAAGLVQTAESLNARLRPLFDDDVPLCRAALEQRHPRLLAIAVCLERPHRRYCATQAIAFLDALVAADDADLVIAASGKLETAVHRPETPEEFLTAVWIRTLSARKWPLGEAIVKRAQFSPNDVVANITDDDSLAHPCRVLEALASGRDLPRIFEEQDKLPLVYFERLVFAIPDVEGKVPVGTLLAHSARFEGHVGRMTDYSLMAARQYIVGGMKTRSLLTALFKAGASWKEVEHEFFAAWQSLLLRKAGERAEVHLDQLREHLRRIGAGDAAKRLQGLSRVRAQREARRRPRW